MKRSVDIDAVTTKRLILGVQKLSLDEPSHRTASPEAQLMELIQSSKDTCSSEDESRQPSSDDSDMEPIRMRRKRTGSDPQESVAKHRTSRSWSLPRILQLKEEEKGLTTNIVTTLYQIRSRPRMHRRASFPSRGRRLSAIGHQQQDGYVGGCECDSDADDQHYCMHCEKDMPSEL